MTKQKLILFNDTTDWYHFGCTGTSLALKEVINDLGFELTAYPISETYKLNNFPASVEGFKERNNFEAFREHNPQIVAAIEVANIVLINGEGTLHGMRPGPVGLLYVAYISKVFLDKHVEIINHSVYPQDDLSLDNDEITSLYKLVYKTLDFVAIREPLSHRLAHRMEIRAEESFDSLPIYIQNHYRRHGGKGNRTLLVAGSAVWANLSMLSNEEGQIAAYESGLSQFVIYLNNMAANGYQLQFLYGANDYPSKDDQQLITFLEKRVRGLIVITANSIEEWLGHIESATLLVSGRFHHTIAAACLGTPFIALNSNTPKVEGMLEVVCGDEANVFSFYGDDSSLANKLLAYSFRVQGAILDIGITERLAYKASANFFGLIDLLLAEEVRTAGPSLIGRVENSIFTAVIRSHNSLLVRLMLTMAPNLILLPTIDRGILAALIGDEEKFASLLATPAKIANFVRSLELDQQIIALYNIMRPGLHLAEEGVGSVLAWLGYALEEVNILKEIGFALNRYLNRPRLYGLTGAEELASAGKALALEKAYKLNFIQKQESEQQAVETSPSSTIQPEEVTPLLAGDKGRQVF